VKKKSKPTGAVDKILASFSEVAEEQEITQYLAFEPFDVTKRPSSVIEQMKLDNVDIYDPALVEVIGTDPHLFQTGYLLSTSPHRVLIAGSRIGKSECALMDAVISATRIVPYSLRAPKGRDTGIKRPITNENILRWGRRDALNGGLIDHDITAKRDDYWDCGTIIGVGIYPTSKFCPPGKQIWIGSTAQALLKYWWPKVFRGAQMRIPQEAMDLNKGANGYSKQNNIAHIQRDIDIILTSYESQYDKFEAEEAWMLILDEEPPDERILPAAASHTKFLSIVETPYRGITYTEDYIFNKDPKRRPEVFHACAYDSPYRPEDKIASDRKTFPPWEIKARIWGLFSEITGVPYFDREKLMKWTDEVKAKDRDLHFVKLAKMIPQKEYQNIEELAKIDVKLEYVDNWNEQDVWRIFELPRPGVGYVAGVDIAEGAETPEEAADRQACSIVRMPLPGTDETEPVKVASLRSTLLVDPFANVVVQGCAFYNNALLAPESVRGYHNGAFMYAVNNYPYFFTMMTTNDKNRKPQSKKGFAPTSKSRETLYKIVERQVTDRDMHEPCPFKDIDLVKELAMAIVGKNGRCDHTRKGSLDTTTAHGIALYVCEVSPEQIRCFRHSKEDEFDAPYSKVIYRVTGKLPEKEQERPHLCAFINS